VTQDSLVVRPATPVAGFQTLTSGLRRVIWSHMPTIGFSRGPSWEEADIARGPEVAERRRRTDPPDPMSASRRKRRR
jgi:hypothetical protein